MNGKLTVSGTSVSVLIARVLMDAIDDGKHWSICLHQLDPVEISWIVERLREAGATIEAITDGGASVRFGFNRLYMWPRSDA